MREPKQIKKPTPVEKTKRSKSIITAILLILITIFAGGTSFLLYDNFKKEKELAIKNTQLEKEEFESDSLEVALQEGIDKLQILKLKYQELDEENKEVKSLIAELVKEKALWKKRSKLNHAELVVLKKPK